ncbi:DNA-binding protein RFX8 [Myotis brandtii]|uniref:DNA-binding protein RFX8 n=1 Tax=Myotis brandtii TaxID=109478 RepID=S7MI09_MYOBR|nr:DNA-binding protein RFX8 [Myotis brandtii]
MAEGALPRLGVWGSHSPHWGISQWLADNFCICEGCSVPHCLMYEIYMETGGQNAQNQVNPATFGKLVRVVFPGLGPRRLGTRGSASGDVIAFEKSTNYGSITQQDGTMAFLADEYCNYCQDILQSVRNQELERVEDLLTAFWKALPQDTVMLMALPEVCQLFKCYDVQMYKGIEDVLLDDFLEDVSIQYLKSVRLFSKKFKLWLLNALEGFPALLQVSKLKGSWHLFHLLLLEYVTHILQSCLEEEVEGDGGNLKEMPPDDQSPVRPDQAPCQPPDSSLSPEDESPCVAPPWVMLEHVSQSQCPMGVSSVVLRVLGFLVDTATGNKVPRLGANSCWREEWKSGFPCALHCGHSSGKALGGPDLSLFLASLLILGPGVWRPPWASSQFRQALGGVVGLVHLHPDPVGGVVRPMGQHFDDVLVGSLQRQSRY